MESGLTQLVQRLEAVADRLENVTLPASSSSGSASAVTPATMDSGLCAVQSAVFVCC